MEPSSVWRLAVWYKDEPVFPVEIFNTNSVEFVLISHPGIAHQDDDVAKEILR